MKHRSIENILYSDQSVDVCLIQPHLLSRELKTEQNRIVLDFWTTMHKYTTLLGDIPSEPNHGIFYIAGSLLKAGYSAEVIDFHAYDRILRERSGRMIEEHDIARAIKAKQARVFGISSKTVAIKRAIRIAELVKEYHPESITVLGGLHPTMHCDDLMKSSNAIDIVIRGDGEHAMVELLDCISQSKSFNEINGISHRASEDTIINNPRIPVNQVDLDSLPYPAYELICEESVPLVPRVLSARGCPHDCAFCSINSYYDGKIGFRDPIKLVDEIQYYVEKLGIDFYCLGDLTFMVNRQYGHKICEEIINRGLDNVKWWCQTTVGRLDQDDVRLMKRAGCVQIALGIEGGTQSILDLAKKPASFSRAEDQCRIIKNEGVSVQTYWLIGMGGETPESAKNRVEEICYFIRNELTDATHISVAVPFPGTPIWQSPEKYGYKINHEKFDEYWMNCDELGYGKPAMETKNLSADHIYMYWQYALACATEEFKKRFADVKGLIHFVPKGLAKAIGAE